MGRGEAFAWAKTPEERTKLWAARHQSYFAALQMRPGCRCQSSDTCVPIEWLMSAARFTPSASSRRAARPSLIRAPRMPRRSSSRRSGEKARVRESTPMASFDQLPAHERWSLAFYVLSLRHGTPGSPSTLPEAERQNAAVQKLSTLAASQ